jgi:uncharacterized RDD family membrane protein YckC
MRVKSKSREDNSQQEGKPMICNSCHNETDAASLFCHICDAYRTNPECGKKANVATRLFAHFLDGLVAITIFFTIVMVSCGIGAAGVGLGSAANSQGVAAGSMAMGFLTFVLAFCGYVVFLCFFISRGKTPGKALVGIRVVDKRDGSFPGFGRMLLRETLGKFVSGLFLGVGYFWAIFDRDSQAWHDKIAGTVVLKGGLETLQTRATLQSGPVPVHERSVGLPSVVNPPSPVALETASVGGSVTAIGAHEPAATRPQDLTNLSVPAATLISNNVPRAICSKCGSSADDDSRFCAVCGSPLQAASGQ